MQNTVNYLAAACASLLLLACAGSSKPQAAAPFLLLSQQMADGHYVLGRNQQAAQQHAEALASYQHALRIDPDHINARNGLATLYAAERDYGKAIALWQSLTSRSAPTPDMAFLFGNLGYAYFLNGDDERALTALEKACVLDPLNGLAWQHLGSVLKKIGQSERAALMFGQARMLQTRAAKATIVIAPQSARNGTRWPMQASSDWIDAMPHTQVEASGGMLQVRRVAARAIEASTGVQLPPQNGVTRAALSAPDFSPALRLEIRNGNGIKGMAAALASTVDGDRLQVIRLLNQSNFLVARTRVEYRHGQERAARILAARLGPLVLAVPASLDGVDVCVILGHDLSDAIALRRHYLKQLKLAKNEPARLDRNG